ncbi:CCHC-type domain-containing protein [Caerostris darwini]|uniref:CCHC-type domain-containing protein n=1 Tax=Caerostris darwini TaxID=1538125 RepID=A0AAV4W7H3_9ARAC|nr:CCHC-type domain-containing protein [Caerostris darwini]
MDEKECDFRPRQKFPPNEPTGYNKRTNPPSLRNDVLRSIYNNKYCGYTQWRHPIQKDNNRCFVCNENTHFARDCSKQKYKFDRINREQNFKWRGKGIERNEGSHISKRDHSLMTDSEGGMSKEISYIKTARINKCPLEFVALIDTGSDSVICTNSVAKRLVLKIDPASNVMYGFGNIKMCAARALGKAKVDISLDSVKVKGVEMLIVRDDALPHELLIGRSVLDRENISFARIGNKFHVCYAEDNPFANMECENNSDVKELKTSSKEILERNSVNFIRVQTTLANDDSVNMEGKEGGLKGILGTPKSVKKFRSGDLLVETANALQSKSLLLAKSFLGQPIIVSPHKTLNTTRGVISEPDLLDCPESEILEGLSEQGLSFRSVASGSTSKSRPPASHSKPSSNPFSLPPDTCPIPTSNKFSSLSGRKSLLRQSKGIEKNKKLKNSKDKSHPILDSKKTSQDSVEEIMEINLNPNERF